MRALLRRAGIFVAKDGTVIVVGLRWLLTGR
jgi:hypothetical protein